MRISATTVKTFQACKRKWAWVALEGLGGPPTPAMQLGTRVHRQLELYLRDGTPFDMRTREGEIAFSGLHLLPAPRTMIVEKPFSVRIDGIPFSGTPDFTSPGFVGDHKTTSNFDFALTPDALALDTQANLYAFVTGATSLQWIYYRTTKPHKALEVRTWIRPNVDPIVAAASEMLSLRGRRALDVAPSFERCDDYGGCSFLTLCNPTPQERIDALMTTTDALSTHHALLASMNGGAVNPPPPVVHPGLPPGYEPDPRQAGQIRAVAPAGWHYDAAGGLVQIPPPPPPVVEPPAPAPAPVGGATPEPAALATETPKRGRGRPRKEPVEGEAESDAELGAAVRVLLRAFRELG